MGNKDILAAINAAAASMNASSSSGSKPKGDVQGSKKSGAKVQPSAAKSQTSKTDTPKTKGGAKYVIPASFKEAIEQHLKGRADMTEKLKQKGKSIDGCCDYIFDVMRKRAEKERKGQSAVGLYAEPDEIFGLAVHYYDESDEDLKKESQR